MAGKESNPIQQRMDLLVERWESVVSRPGVHIVRIHAQENEKDMVSTFYNYMLGVNTPNKDIPVIFESIFHDPDQYTRTLLKELERMLDIWNNANKDALTIKIERINWAPDYTLVRKDNPAYLFTENMNRLAAYLALGKGIYLPIILKVSFVQPTEFCRWLESALKAGLSDKCKIVIDDSAAHPFYKKMADKYPADIATLYPRLDMDNAMQQVAAMGRPGDPAVQYRQAFIRLMQAIEKRKEKEAKEYAAVCIDIANDNIPKNAYWIGQIIAVYAALSNDQVGYKNFKKAIGYATDGVETAEKSQGLITDEYIYRKFIAQAVMLRASLYVADKEWQKAIADFERAAENYVYTNDLVLAMEAFRMLGYTNRKFGNTDAACKTLARAMEVAAKIPVHILKFTTFAGIIEILLEINNSKYIGRTEVEEFAASVYGKDWMKEIMNWKSPHYAPVVDASKTIVT
jgi:tetratricopeptide (TPR) repeat protein